MFYIALYDIANEKRLPKVLKVFRKYLHWIQNSCFEGELNESQFKKLVEDLSEIIKKNEDSILFFSSPSKKYIYKDVMGIEKNEISFFI